MKRKLFLGVGGSGSKVIELYSHSTMEKENVNFLVLDTDIEALGRISNIPKLCLSEYNSLGNVIDKLGKETISDWFPCDDNDEKVNYFRSLETGKGTNGWRMKGLLSFEYMLQDQEKRRLLIGALEQLFKSKQDSKIGEEIDAEICVVASACGGTGSSVALATCMFIKRYVKSVFGKEVKVKLLLACPEIYENCLTSENKIKARANAYATFREINAIDLVSKGYNQLAKEKNKSTIELTIGSEKSNGIGLLFDSHLPIFSVRSANPFDKVYVFNRVVGETTISAHEQIMAKLLTVITDEPIISEEEIYSTVSISEVTYPHDSILDYVVKQKTFNELESEWLWLYNVAKKRMDNPENNLVSQQTLVDAFVENIIDAYKNEHNAKRVFDYLVLNRLSHNNDLAEYNTDAIEITDAHIDNYVKNLLEVIKETINYNEVEQLKKDLENNISSIVKVKLFDSKLAKKKKSEKFHEFVCDAMKKMTKFHKQNIENISSSINSILIGLKSDSSAISIENNLLKLDGNYVHPVMALKMLCMLYKNLTTSFNKLYSSSLLVAYDEEIIPKKVLQNINFNQSANNAYNTLAKPRLSTVLEYKNDSVPKEIIGAVECVKEEIIEASLEISYLFITKILTAVHNYIGSLIEKYMNTIEGVKALIEERRIDVKIALISDTTDTCTRMNVGSSEEQKKHVFDAFVESDTNQFLVDQFIGEQVYKAIISNSEIDIFKLLCEKRKELAQHNQLLQKVKNNNIFRVLHERDLLVDDLPKKTKYKDFSKAFSMVALPADLDIVNDEEHKRIRVDVDTMVSIHSSQFARQMLWDEKLSDQEALDKYLFEQGNFEAKVTVSDNLPGNKIYFIRKVNNIKPWFFKYLDDNQTGGNYYVDYLKALSVKKQQFTQMWNPHLVKEKVKDHYLPFINPAKQENFEKGVYKAILYMLDKGVLLVSPNQAQKDIFCYKEASNDVQPIFFENKQVLFENVYDLFGFARQRAELTIKYSDLFNASLEKECAGLELNIYNDATLPLIKNGILKSDIVKMLLGDMYKSVRSINKIESKSLLDFIYDISLIDKYKFETVNLVGVIRDVLIYMVRYRTINNDEGFEKLYFETISSIKDEYEKNMKQAGIKGYKQRKEVVFKLFENK